LGGKPINRKVVFFLKASASSFRDTDNGVPRAQQTAERLRRCATVWLMREGPSESACRSRLQTTFGGFGQKPRSWTRKEKARIYRVRWRARRGPKGNHCWSVESY